MLVKFRIPEIVLGALLAIAVFQLGIVFASSIDPPPQQAQDKNCDNGAKQESVDVAGCERTVPAEDRIAVYTLWLTVVTAVLSVATVALVGVGALQFKDSRVLQRAYLWVDGYGFDPFDGGPKHSVAEIGVTNAGNMPARHVTWFIDCDLNPDGKRSNFPIDETRFYGRQGQMVIAPGATMRRSQNEAFDPTAVEHFRTAGWHLYVWGEIRYLDGFGVQRFTRFCHRYDARQLFPKRDEYGNTVWFITSQSMRYHQYGNDAD